MNEPSFARVPEAGSNRSFGLLVGSVLALIGALVIQSSGNLALSLLVSGSILILLAVARPAILGPLNRLWFRLGLLLGRLSAPIIMGLVFVFAIIPSRLLLLVLRKDPLQSRGRYATTFWLRRETSSSFKEQF